VPFSLENYHTGVDGVPLRRSPCMIQRIGWVIIFTKSLGADAE